MIDQEWDEIYARFSSQRHELNIFMKSVRDFFFDHPKLQGASGPILHSTRMRLKDSEHLRQKVIRKRLDGREINAANLFNAVTDLAGVRLLLLFQSDYRFVDEIMREKLASGDWHLAERGRAFTWDPENAEFFSEFDLDVETRPTSYTSVHFVVRPRADSPNSCELQVRTLFEEIWGEIDHQINYPVPTTSVAAREQLRVLSKIVGAGSRSVDAIQRSLAAEAGDV